MALWHFTNFNKYGNPRSRIFHRPDGEAFFTWSWFWILLWLEDLSMNIRVRLCLLPILELNGKTYLMPLWKEVVKGTTIR